MMSCDRNSCIEDKNNVLNENERDQSMNHKENGDYKNKILNLSAKEFVSKGGRTGDKNKGVQEGKSPSSLLAPKMNGLNMMPSPTFTSQSWIVDNLRSLISNQDDETSASESEMSMPPHISVSTAMSWANEGAKKVKTDERRSPFHSIGNFEIDEIERARRERFETGFRGQQFQNQSSSHNPNKHKETSSLGIPHGGLKASANMNDEDDCDDLNGVGYACESMDGGSFYEERSSKRPFSPDEIHELTPYQQLQYQIQQEQLQKQQQQSFYFQHPNNIDYGNDFHQSGSHHLGVRGFIGMDGGFEACHMRKNNMFRSSSSSKISNKIANNDCNVVKLNERKQKSLIRLNSEIPSRAGSGEFCQMDSLYPDSSSSSFNHNCRLNKSPSDNNLLAHFRKPNNQPCLAKDQLRPSKTSSSSLGCPNIFISQAASLNVPEFVPKSHRLSSSSSMHRHNQDTDGMMSDFNNNSISGSGDFDASISGESNFNPYANRRNYSQYLSQRMQSARHSMQMSDLKLHSLGVGAGNYQGQQSSHHRYSMVNTLEPSEMMMMTSTRAAHGHHGLKKMAKSSSSLVNQYESPFSGRQYCNNLLNDTDMGSTSFMSASTNLDDSMMSCGSYQQKWHHQNQHGFGNNKKWMHLNQQPAQQYQQMMNHQQMQQHASRDNLRSINMTDMMGDDEYQQDQKEHIVLHVKNLDYKISADEWKRILLENFRKHCKEIISVNVITNADKSLLGVVKLGTKEDTRLAISCLHHKKIGYKRLNVQVASSLSSNSPK